MKYQTGSIATLAILLGIGMTTVNISAQTNTPTTTAVANTNKTQIKDGFPWWVMPFLAAGSGLLWVFRKKPEQVNTYTAPLAFFPSIKSSKVATPIPFPVPPRGYKPAPFPVENLSPGLREVWLSVHDEPTDFDSIMSHSQRSPEDMKDALSALESMGLITQLPGRKYQRIATT